METSAQMVSNGENKSDIFTSLIRISGEKNLVNTIANIKKEIKDDHDRFLKNMKDDHVLHIQELDKNHKEKLSELEMKYANIIVNSRSELYIRQLAFFISLFRQHIKRLIEEKLHITFYDWVEMKKYLIAQKNLSMIEIVVEDLDYDADDWFCLECISKPYLEDVEPVNFEEAEKIIDSLKDTSYESYQKAYKSLIEVFKNHPEIDIKKR